MTNEEKGILGEKYVSKKIKEVIKTLGKDIRLYGPIILKYYSIYGEMTCEIDHIIVLGNTIILGETKNGSYENIDYEASCWTLLNGNDITDNPIVQNHYHKEVFCSEFGLERHNVVTAEFLLNYEECKTRTQNPNDYVLGKDNIDKYLLLLLYFYSDNIEKCDNSKLCEKLQIYQYGYSKLKAEHIKKLEKVKRIEEKTRTRDGNYRFKRTDIARCPNCNSFLYLNGENKIVHVRKSFQIEVKCKRCNFFVPPFKDDDKGVRSGFYQIKAMHLEDYKGWKMEEHIDTAIDIYEKMKEENAILKEKVQNLISDKDNEKREFENVLCSLKEESRKKENEIYFLKMELKKAKDENGTFSHFIGPIYVKNNTNVLK